MSYLDAIKPTPDLFKEAAKYVPTAVVPVGAFFAFLYFFLNKSEKRHIKDCGYFDSPEKINPARFSHLEDAIVNNIPFGDEKINTVLKEYYKDEDKLKKEFMNNPTILEYLENGSS